MIYTIYGYKVPNYVFFTFINDICKKYNFLEINEDDSEQIEEAKSFLKLNLRYCMEKYNNTTPNNLIEYRTSIAIDIFRCITELDIIKQYLKIKKDDIIKSIKGNDFMHDDVSKYILMDYTTLNNIDNIQFKSIDNYQADNQPINYDIITGICLNEIDTDEMPYSILIEDDTLIYYKDIIIELFGNEFKEHKLGLIISKVSNE